MRRVILVTGALCLTAGVLGFTAGRGAGPPDAGEAIRRVAAEMAAETGAAAEDCVGTPGAGEVWIVVRCGDAVVRLDRRGRAVAAPASGT